MGQEKYLKIVDLLSIDVEEYAMKKILVLLVAIMMVFSLAACGGKTTESNGETEPPKVSYDRNDMSSILSAIEKEYEVASQTVTDESVVVFEKIGETYDSYDKNKATVTAFYNSSLTEAT